MSRLDRHGKWLALLGLSAAFAMNDAAAASTAVSVDVGTEVVVPYGTTTLRRSGSASGRSSI